MKKWGDKQMLPLKPSESDIRGQVKDYLRLRGWFVWYILQAGARNCKNTIAKLHIEGFILAMRTYQCECGLEIDRDVNAAINLRNYAVQNMKGIA